MWCCWYSTYMLSISEQCSDIVYKWSEVIIDILLMIFNCCLRSGINQQNGCRAGSIVTKCYLDSTFHRWTLHVDTSILQHIPATSTTAQRQKLLLTTTTTTTTTSYEPAMCWWNANGTLIAPSTGVSTLYIDTKVKAEATASTIITTTTTITTTSSTTTTLCQAVVAVV